MTLPTVAGVASLVVSAMEMHSRVEEVQARGCALLKTLAWGRRTPSQLYDAGAVIVIVEAIRTHPRSIGVVGEACKALENLCRDADELGGLCTQQACRADLLRLLLQVLRGGKMGPLVPLNLVHELYHNDPGVTDPERPGALDFEELKRLQLWYSKIVRVPDKGHL
uniref:Uncharacterized protein n=1 Tax=Haptolina ericina TaxID=156174 RepID=A0A7S3BL37_9EUKA|mmetsp:Transcript_62834/g.139913  ORF Transcript_62834/g.139913 Transcript_62834/m.139913 type:complete len:166 (+) Transcript_62834:2-499(+)